MERGSGHRHSYVAGQDTYLLNNNVFRDPETGDITGTGTLGFVEDEDGVSVTVAGFGKPAKEGAEAE